MLLSCRLYRELPKLTKPPLVLKSSMDSPLSSGGGIGAQVQYLEECCCNNDI
ncbi:unnamed protein product [Linum tenue]|uniref:Uncharacterized protein n=1 Tax=Linum tenue TaxID=586396 RepID=A0AAV0LUW0_9ROSI|nr:unnamed protein product [Linum tenue]